MRVTPVFRLLYLNTYYLKIFYINACNYLESFYFCARKVINKCFYEKQITIFGQSAVSYDCL